MNRTRNPLLLLLLVATTLSAGVVMKNTHTRLKGNNTTTTTTTLTVGDEAVRMDAGSLDAGGVFIYRKDRDLCWVIDQEEKSYMEITRADLAAMSSTIRSAMKEMEEQLKSLPPEQRAMVESMMKGMKGAESSITFLKVGSNQKVGKWVCDKYEGAREGVAVLEVWVTDWKKLGLSQGDIGALTGLADFFAEFSKDLGNFFKPGTKAAGGYEGMPVKTVTLSDGQETSTTMLSSINKEKTPASLFEVPAGFKKKKLTEKMGR